MYLQTLTTLIFHVKINFHLSKYKIHLIYLILPVKIQNLFDFTCQDTKFFWFIWFYLSKQKIHLIYLILPVKIQNSFDLFDFTSQNTKFIWFIWFYQLKYKIHWIYLILPVNIQNLFDLTCQDTKFFWFIWFYLSKQKNHLIYLILPVKYVWICIFDTKNLVNWFHRKNLAGWFELSFYWQKSCCCAGQRSFFKNVINLLDFSCQKCKFTHISMIFSLIYYNYPFYPQGR